MDAGDGGTSSLLAQRAVADDPRWTRAVEDNPTIPREGCAKSSGGGERVEEWGEGRAAVPDSMLAEPPR